MRLKRTFIGSEIGCLNHGIQLKSIFRIIVLDSGCGSRSRVLDSIRIYCDHCGTAVCNIRAHSVLRFLRQTELHVIPTRNSRRETELYLPQRCTMDEQRLSFWLCIFEDEVRGQFSSGMLSAYGILVQPHSLRARTWVDMSHR
jgi:hypothetical protein